MKHLLDSDENLRQSGISRQRVSTSSDAPVLSSVTPCVHAPGDVLKVYQRVLRHYTALQRVGSVECLSVSRGCSRIRCVATCSYTCNPLALISIFYVGKVAEEGSHEELVAKKGGVYSSLVKRQLDLYDRSESASSSALIDLGKSTPGPSSRQAGRKSIAQENVDSCESLTASSSGSFDKESSDA